MSERQSPAVDAYLATLRSELRRRDALDDRFIEESRGHLSDAIDAGVGRGLTLDAACAEAVARFGDPRTVAAKLAAEKDRTLHWTLFATALALGLAIAWVDARPRWDDAGITAGMLFLSAGVLGFVGPRRPWLWASAIGLSVPLHLVLRSPSIVTLLGSFVILSFPMAGASAGMGIRRMVQHAHDLEA